MGSSSSGRTKDYPGSSRGTSRGSAGSSDGSGADDRCARAFNVRLEDIEQSGYYKKHGTTPPVGTQLKVIQLKRLVANTSAGESVGNLPTGFNYLASCIKAGWTYVGVLRTASSGPPSATVSADFAATPPP